MSKNHQESSRVVLITGAAGVFGRWIAQDFAASGDILCLSDRRLDKLEQLQSELGLPEERVMLHATELRSEASILELFEKLGARFGSADIVINNAGLYPSGFLMDIEVDLWDAIMEVNVRAPFLVARNSARQMIQQSNKGTIINIGSGAARSMRTTMVPYCVSKTALDRLTKGLALELAGYGIRVNALEPGFAPGSEVSPLPDEHVTATAGRIPLGRTSEPEDVPAAIRFLCSDAASFITGATLSVDGGISAGSLAVYQDKKEATL